MLKERKKGNDCKTACGNRANNIQSVNFKNSENVPKNIPKNV